MSMMLKDIPDFLKPRERLKSFGVSSLSNEELIAILLRTGIKSTSVKELSLEVLKTIEKISDLNNVSLNQFMSISGIGEAKAMSIIAALELGKRVYLFNDKDKIIKINNSYTVYNLYKYLRMEEQENLIALFLDNKNCLIKSTKVFKGTVNSSIAHPRDIFKLAIRNNASSIIIVHNHPSGDATPSKEDITFTNNIFTSGKIIGIPVIEHVIIGNNNYYSFKENKMVIL